VQTKAKNSNNAVGGVTVAFPDAIGPKISLRHVTSAQNNSASCHVSIFFQCGGLLRSRSTGGHSESFE